MVAEVREDNLKYGDQQQTAHHLPPRTAGYCTETEGNSSVHASTAESEQIPVNYEVINAIA